MGDAARSHERWRRRPCGRSLWTHRGNPGMGVRGKGQRRLWGRLLSVRFSAARCEKQSFVQLTAEAARTLRYAGGVSPADSINRRV